MKFIRRITGKFGGGNLKQFTAVVNKLFEWRWTFHYTIILGTLIRLIALVWVSSLPSLIGDPLEYQQMAKRLLSHIGFEPFWPPGLPYYLVVLFSFFGEAEFVARVGMILWYWLLALGIFLLTKKIANRKTANISIFLFTIFPTFIYHSVTPLTQLPMAALLVAAAFFAIQFKSKIQWGSSIFLGSILGFATLIRPSTVLLVVMLPLYLFVITRKTRHCLLIVVSALLVISVWIFKAYDLTGKFVMINYSNSMNFFLGNNPWTPLYKTWYLGSHPSEDPQFEALRENIKKNSLAIQDKLHTQYAVNHILARPDLFFLRSVNRLRNFFAFDTYTGSALIKEYGINKIMGLGIIALDAFFYLSIALFALLFFVIPYNKFNDQSGVIIFLIIIVGYSLPYWISFSHPTYHFPIVPLLGILSAISSMRLLSEPRDIWNHIKSSKRKKYVLLSTMSLLIFIQIEWIAIMFSRI